MERFFTTWPSRPFIFASEEAKLRHARLVCTPKPAVVLTELREIVGRYFDISSLDCVPRSKYRPEMLLKPCRKFEEGGRMPLVHRKELRRAVRKVKDLLVRKQKMTPLELSEVPFDASKNSGLPYLLKKSDVYKETLELARECERGKCPPPMCMFARGKNLDVARPVLAGPFEWQLLEGKFFYPLQEYLLSFDNPYLVGRKSHTVAAKLNQLTYSPYVLCMDYSGFDGSISSELIDSAFAILRCCLSLNDQEACQWKAIVSYFITSPILCPDQRVYYGRRHGVPSGSMFTQMIDTVVNMIIIEYISERLVLEKGQYYVVGDDSVISGTFFDLSTIIQTAAEIGICVHPTKSEVVDTSKTSSIHFLGHTYEMGVPSRPIEDTLTRLLTPERICREMYSKDAAVRRKYYLNRIRAYQEDNADPEAWRVLRLVEVRTRMPDNQELIVKMHAALECDRHFFQSTEIVERDRWDANRKQLREEASKRWLRAAVFWM